MSLENSLSRTNGAKGNLNCGPSAGAGREHKPPEPEPQMRWFPLRGRQRSGDQYGIIFTFVTGPVTSEATGVAFRERPLATFCGIGYRRK